MGRVSFESMMPPDPFAGDPNDPASFLPDDGPMPHITEQERAEFYRDLALVAQFKEVLGPKGFEGVFFYCEDCDTDHYFGWDILAANIRATIEEDLSPVHEPSANPNVARYVPWDYAVGYLDGATGRL